jgi:hypothetical protein
MAVCACTAEIDMTKEELIKRLETTCFGLDPIDPLRLLVDDVIAALAQPQRTWVRLTDEERKEIDHLALSRVQAVQMTEAKLKELNT